MSRKRFVLRSGDDRTGEGGGDDETIKVQLEKLQPTVHYVLFVINVFSRPNFGDVRSCAVRMYHGSAKPKFKTAPLMEYHVTKGSGFDACQGMFMCTLARQGAWWSVHALGLPARYSVCRLL